MLMTVMVPAFADTLEQRFMNPPDAVRPGVYWYWINGHITKEGITRDLEAMQRVGIGRGYIGIINTRNTFPVQSEPKALTDEWWELIEHAIREAGRLGVDIGLFNSPGWSQSGGPWVKPEQTMRYLTAPEMRLHGPQHFEGKLPVPPGNFQDIAVVAFPAPGSEGVFAKETERTPTSATFEMPTPFTARSITVQPVARIKVTATLQASDDGSTYRNVKTFTIDRHNVKINVGPVPLAPITTSFPATTARFFRVTFSLGCKVGDIRISPAVKVESFAEKTLVKMFQDNVPPFDFYSWPEQEEADLPGLAIKPEHMLDLTTRLGADGILRWDVPAGEWIVLRTAMTPTGMKNRPAPPEATGLEVDKMNVAALRAHFNAYMGDLLKRMPASERKAWKYVIADSFEMGPQNWTDDFAAGFRKRYGYDPLPWLPVMTGRVVGSAGRSDRFLWDLRRLVADRIATDYVGGLSALCHEHGLKMWLENYGHWGYPSEFLKYGGACDEIGGEFWMDSALGPVELRDAASVAHIYGKPVVWAEAFTGGPAYRNAPRDLKARGDWAFCEGASQFVLHLFIHQPWEDKKPGINAWFGTEFNRHNTWFEYSRPWVDYLRRCSVLLQTGQHVADVAYFISEDAPKMAGIRQPELPAGHDYDYINGEVLLSAARVSDGRLTLRSGMSYGALVLPPVATMRPELLKKIAGFVSAGLPVFGPLPSRSPSLENFPACDAEVATMAADLRGRVHQGNDLRTALTVPPDVVCADGILWTHRRGDDTDIYFISNQGPLERDETISFRVNGRAPELWWPDSGMIESAPFSVKEGRTAVSVRLDPAGSVFVVFRARKSDAPLHRPGLRKLADIDGPWQVTFPALRATFDKLISWTESPNAAIKYHSGASTYRTTFLAPGTGGETRVFLDLGRVEALATVSVNGSAFPALWKLPYRVDITSALRPGKNELAITVVNTWNNRLVGDAQPGVTNLVTFLSLKAVNGNTPLQPAGLLGPVTLQTVITNEEKR